MCRWFQISQCKWFSMDIWVNLNWLFINECNKAFWTASKIKRTIWSRNMTLVCHDRPMVCSFETTCSSELRYNLIRGLLMKIDTFLPYQNKPKQLWSSSPMHSVLRWQIDEIKCFLAEMYVTSSLQIMQLWNEIKWIYW